VTVFLTAGDPVGAGIFLLAGQADRVRAAGASAAKLMEGKGGGPPGVFQGKAAKLSGREAVLDILKSR
jgi:hypothetical protein